MNLRTYISILLLFSSIAVCAQDCLQVLKSNSQSILSITSDFKQTKHSALLKNDEISTGKFYFSRADNKICLHYLQPTESRMVITNSEIFFVANGKTTSLSIEQNPALAQIGILISACLTGDFVAFADKDNMTFQENDDTFTIKINPENRRIKKYIAEMILTFRRADNSLKIMQFTEANGDKSTYEYFNVTTNTSIDKNLFITN